MWTLLLLACRPDDAGPAPEAEPLTWPNETSAANSDPWLIEHHDEVEVLRPRVLVLDFVNGRPVREIEVLLQDVIEGFREGSRYHGYADERAPAVLEYEITRLVDLTDASPPPGWPFGNSTLFPRQDPPVGSWGFDYGALFGPEMAARWDLRDPDTDEVLDLCGLVDRGMVHEVWVVGDADVPDASMAEVLEIKPIYTEDGTRLPGAMNRCAGNGCFDAEDRIPETCTRSLRIGFVNHSRGPGCYLHSLGHGFEWTARTGSLPWLVGPFEAFADMDLDERYGLPFDSWYACTEPDCVTFESPTRVAWSAAGRQGTIDPYEPRCGNVHVAPNSRYQYDDTSPTTVRSTCRTIWQGDEPEDFSTADFAPYGEWGDCGGPWQVWWRQSWPGLGNQKVDPETGAPVRSWWPYLFW